MTAVPVSTILYRKPDIQSLVEQGYYPVDMHLHTVHSDGLTRISDLIDYARNNHIGVAITDHNEIGGVIEAVSGNSDLLLVPGIELETTEGPHLLVYFYTSGDLEDFYRDFNRERSRETPGLLKNLPVSACLTLAESYDCLKIAAHPFGYYGINRGVLKCVEKNMLPGVLNHIDGIEVICGGMISGLNQKAMRYALHHPVLYTGGSDAHILSDVGSVVTAVQADTVEEFLNGIQRRENIVIGKSSGCLQKGATAGVIAWSFFPYTISWISAHYSFHTRKTSRILSMHQKRFSSFRHQIKEDCDGLEKRGKEP